jgi:hypothetical protein
VHDGNLWECCGFYAMVALGWRERENKAKAKAEEEEGKGGALRPRGSLIKFGS